MWFMNKSLGVFLKAGGVRQENGSGTNGATYTDHGCYWTSTIGTSKNAYNMEFWNTEAHVNNTSSWFGLQTNGLLIRCVKGTKQ